MEGNKILRKIKNRFKFNKLILYVYTNSFYLFLSIIPGLKNIKICKILRNFNYILLKNDSKVPTSPRLSIFSYCLGKSFCLLIY